MKKLIILTLFVLAAAPLFALSEGDRLFKEALEGNAAYSEAAAAYADQAAELPDSPALYYNLGNALYLAGERVSALTAYSAALDFKPSDGEFRSNRALVLEEMGLKESSPGAAEAVFWFPVFLLGLKGLWYLILALLLLAAAAAIVWLLKKNGILRTSALILLILEGLLTASALTWESRCERRGYVLTHEVQLRKGDSPLYDTVSTLSEGTELTILETREGWCRVKTASTGSSKGVEGWLKRNDIMNREDLIER
ncbi:MAG: hypothetical protein PQJ50_16220 [Spirochaetales bacterium]|nr:hypothetical protein [Spirochaetales bacterium]